MTDAALVYDIHEHNDHMTTPAGQLYGPNEQCKQHLGGSSYYAWVCISLPSNIML